MSDRTATTSPPPRTPRRVTPRRLTPRRLTPRRLTPRQVASDLGMATAEYAIATLAACGFAGMLLALLRSAEVRGLLSGIIRRALAVS